MLENAIKNSLHNAHIPGSLKHWNLWEESYIISETLHSPHDRKPIGYAASKFEQV